MAQDSLDTRFSTEPILPLILGMALPAVVAQLVNLLYSIVDRMYIGHIPGIGSRALAGVGICSTLITLVSSFPMIVGGGGAPLASIALGSGEKEKAERILGTGCAMLAFFSIALIVGIGANLLPLLRLCGASVETLPYASAYFSWYLLGTPFVMVTVALNPFLNVQGKPKAAMLSIVLGAILNILLDPLFMFGFGLGVQGAAIASVASQAASAVLILALLVSPNAGLRLLPRRIRFEGTLVWRIFSLGISPFAMASTESLVGFVLNRELVRYGDVYVGALAIMQSAMLFTSTPSVGFSQGANPVISYNYGHRDAGRVREAFWVVLRVMFSFTFIMTGLMMLAPKSVARIFTSDPELIDTVGKWMPLFLSGFLIFGLQRACQQTFVALGQAGISLFIALLRKVILLIPLVIALSRLLGLKGVFMGEAIADGLCAILCSLIFAYRFPKILKQIQ
ncbi:MAG: MATE family efflux transporter [Sphaerochaetaceae bacterium]|nr:MATE family efflux transporter [Spirochaetales bacterium]MDY5499694.1 MATE family efflux transporter [Sphaerochaetaceae bacterium]